MSQPAPWPIESTRVDYQCPIFRVHRDRVRSPRTGEVHDFVAVQPDDAAVALALTPGGELVMVEQFRHGVRRVTLELPGGALGGEGPLEAAARELREETGYEAAALVQLGTVDLNPGWETTQIHLVLARDAVPRGEPEQDEGEDIRVRPIPLEQVFRMAERGEIRNAVALTGLFLLRAHLGL